jgi:hypothetical protein
MQDQTDFFPGTVAPPLRRDLTGADAIVPRLARDMTEAAIEFGAADIGYLRALGWTPAQLADHGFAAAARARDEAEARARRDMPTAAHPAERDPRIAAAHDAA